MCFLKFEFVCCVCLVTKKLRKKMEVAEELGRNGNGSSSIHVFFSSR